LSSCALATGGVAYCWGNNSFGQLGNGTQTSSTVPVAVSMPSGVSFATIATGFEHTCAVTTTGTAYCWGGNYYGQLGNNASTRRSTTPVAVNMQGVSFVTISIGDYHTCALTTTGTVYCWGNNANGQIGTGSAYITEYRSPELVRLYGVSFSALATGNYHTCAVTTTGAVYCWGMGANGQLGNNQETDSRAPVMALMPGDVSFRAIDAGSYFTCALTTIGTAYCWGFNSNGQLGDGTTTYGARPVAVSMPSGVSFATIATGYFHACAVTTTGTAYCWGKNMNGQFGDGTTTDSAVPVAVSMPSEVSFATIAPGANHTCAFTTTGASYCWGGNDNGQLGTCDIVGYTVPMLISACAPVNTSTPTQTQTSTNTPPTSTATSATNPWGSFTSVDTNGETTCAIATSGAAYCWGNNSQGQLGNGTTGGYSSGSNHVAVTMPTGVTFATISTSGNHTCARTTTGTAYCWGYNGDGQLGDGTVTSRTVPVAVIMPTGVLFSAIAASGGNTCALTTAGAAYCWGGPYYGSLGRGPTAYIGDYSVPGAVTMPDGVSFSEIYIGSNYTCALTTTGTVYCWGYNNIGQLGDNSYTNRFTPVEVYNPDGVSFAAISTGSGASHACALTTTGAAYCWGSNTYSELGTGNTGSTRLLNAVTMPDGVSFATITVGDEHTCALTTTGTAY
jgi:alpha-tubulin suppressor-like RCC1 family protein